jgi:hypothetical protein
MTPNDAPDGGLAQASPEDIRAALFANLVIQQTNTALILLGRVPNPETGERMQDLEAARLFIDQLEMLEFKTKGNLTSQEEQLLKQSLTSLRMAFVEAVESPTPKGQPSAAQKGQPTSPSGSDQAAPSGSIPAEEEHRKKFSKKY